MMVPTVTNNHVEFLKYKSNETAKKVFMHLTIFCIF